MRRLTRWLVLLPLIASACWVTKGEVRHKVNQFQDDVETADTGQE